MEKALIKKFVELTNEVSSESKDKSMKVGCIFVDDFYEVIATGYNKFPTGVKDLPERHERPLKYLWTEHAERNAIYNASKNGVSLKGSVAFTNYFPCIDCTRGLIEVGIKALYAPKADFEHKKWGESWIAAHKMFTECGVEINWIK